MLLSSVQREPQLSPNFIFIKITSTRIDITKSFSTENRTTLLVEN